MLRQQFNERNRDLIVNVGGKLAHRRGRGFAVRFFGAGRRRGVGLRLTNGRIFALDEHLARLRHGARARRSRRTSRSGRFAGRWRPTECGMASTFV